MFVLTLIPVVPQTWFQLNNSTEIILNIFHIVFSNIMMVNIFTPNHRADFLFVYYSTICYWNIYIFSLSQGLLNKVLERALMKMSVRSTNHVSFKMVFFQEQDLVLGGDF